MSNPHKKHIANDEHGTISSYVIGFILSLIFTIIPYFMVVNKVLTGNSLLLAILGIGVLQMIIQLVFFLHLGRGPKPFYNVVFFFATALTIIVVIGASIFIMDNLYRTMSPKEFIIRQSQSENIAQISGNETGACVELRKTHNITINGGVSSSNIIEAERCDTISFINEDQIDHEIAFGEHPEDPSYGGLFELFVESGETEIMTLNETGEFILHAHSSPDILINLLVAEQVPADQAD